MKKFYHENKFLSIYNFIQHKKMSYFSNININVSYLNKEGINKREIIKSNQKSEIRSDFNFQKNFKRFWNKIFK
jgi:hypothetical protein